MKRTVGIRKHITIKKMKSFKKLLILINNNLPLFQTKKKIPSLFYNKAIYSHLKVVGLTHKEVSQMLFLKLINDIVQITLLLYEVGNNLLISLQIAWYS